MSTALRTLKVWVQVLLCAQLMGEDIKLLHQDLTGDCKDAILNEIKYLDELKSKMADLASEKFKLEEEYNRRIKTIRSMSGVVFDYIIKDEPFEYTVNRTNILLKNVNGGNRPW